MIVGGVADELLLVGQQVMPNKLEGSEFVFAYPSIDEAIAAIES
jgi:NAD dependent epimerase/dehydratase family enzyme